MKNCRLVALNGLHTVLAPVKRTDEKQAAQKISISISTPSALHNTTSGTKPYKAYKPTQVSP